MNYSTNKCILYIDDQFEGLLSMLQLFEEDYNYTILTESSVQEGLKTLDNYYGVIDAVILDLQFPENELQGKEGLEIIKNKYANIPVFVLTGASNPKEEEEAKECLANGATNYYHKSNFDVKTLMLQINNAVTATKKSKQLSRLKNYRNVVSDAPHLEILSIHNTNEYVGIFAYKLIHTITTEDTKTYFNWCTDVLRTLAIGFENLSITQLHNKGVGYKVDTYILFSLKGKSKTAIKNSFEEVFFNFSLFFNNAIDLQPAQFKPITNSNHLITIANLESKSPKKAHFLFKRKTKEINTDISVEGFSSKQPKETVVEIPILLSAEHLDFDFLYYLLDNLESALISTRIKKITLNIDEIKLLNTAKLRFDGKDTLYLGTIQDLLNNQEQLFQVRTTFYSQTESPINVLNNIAQMFYQNQASHIKVSQNFYSDYPMEMPFKRFPFLFSIDTINSVFRLPYLTADYSSTHTLIGSKEVSIPNQSLNKKGIIVGKHHYGDVFIDKKQFKKHTYIIGKTGTGKTSVLYAMFMDCIDKGQGAALIDPHGDVFDKIYEAIPSHRKKDVIIFDPTDSKNKFGFNILDYNKSFPEQQSFIVNELLKMFNDMYDMKMAGGPMFEMYFKNAAYLVMETIPNATLEDISKVYADANFLGACLKKCSNQKILDFYKIAQATTGEQGFENFAPYITSKLTRFTDNHYLNRVICDASRSFNFREMMDGGKIFLVKLNKGKLSDEGVNFIGRLLFNRIIMAAYTRSDVFEEHRKDFALFVDEFQNFTSSDIVSALGETRKYHLQLVLANQTFAQLDDNVAKNILSNVGSIITAAVSPFDAEMIVPFLEPEYNKQDIVQLDNYKFIISTLYNNKRENPFIFNSIPY